MKLIIPVLFLLFSQLSLFAQEENKDSLKFILNIRAQFDNYEPSNLDTTLLFTFIIKSSKNQIDTLYSTDTNYVEMQLEPETDYSAILFNNVWDLPSYTSFSTKGHSKNKVFFEEFFLREPIVIVDDIFTCLYSLNDFKKPINKFDSATFPIDEIYTLLIENNEVIKTLLLSGYRYENEKKSVSLKRAEYFKNELIKMGIDKDRLVVEDGGICNKCYSLVNISILNFYTK